SKHPFVTIYLNTKWSDEQQRERIRLFIKNQLKKAYDQLQNKEVWQKQFLEDQKQIEKYVEGIVRQNYEEGVNGVAIFSQSAKKTFLTYPSIIPFENEFFVSEAPIIKPITKLSSQYQNTLVVMVETDSAKLLEISLEGRVEEISIESYVPGRHDQGGWAQMRYQRHIKYHMDRHHSEVANHLTTLFDSGKWKRIVLIGQDRIIANFKNFIPERVKQQIVDNFSMDFSQSRSEILERVFRRLIEKDKDEINHQVKELMEKAYKRGMANFGLNGTLEAINAGQVHTLYLLTSFALAGAKCLKCGALLSTYRSGLTICPLCKGEIKEVDLAEEMIKSVLRQDGD
ncbi:MAG: Vms1/Ankzf1 family peptidyl-tRNA hydrolase, partial [Fervidobacterium sp.]